MAFSAFGDTCFETNLSSVTHMAFFCLNRTSVILMGCILALCVWSCEPNLDNLITSPKDLPPAIFAFLNTAADSQYVIIRNSLPPEGQREEFIEAEYNRIRQASVEIEGRGERFVFNKPYEIEPTYDYSRIFVYASAHKVFAGETYQLRVQIPEKGVFTASATAPSDFDILVPNSVDTIDVFQPIEVRTTVPQGAAGYRVSLWSRASDSTDTSSGSNDEMNRRWGLSYRYFKTLNNPSGFLSHYIHLYYEDPQYRGKQLRVELSVEALDTAAWLSRDVYFDSTSGIAGGRNGGEEFRLEPLAFSNIEGGRGVMTAITTKMIPLRFPPIPK